MLVRVDDLTKVFRRAGLASGEGTVAVNKVSLTVRKGETLAVVGESGSGKSTLARCLTWLERPTSGSIEVFGRNALTMSRKEVRRHRRDVQIIFQNPGASLDPRWRVGRILAEPLKIHGLWGKPDFDQRALETLMEIVGLAARDMDKFPHEFSGGQRQRIAIAKAIALRPRLVVCDEPVSALDVSIRAGVINLLMDLRERLDVSYLFIGHDLAVVRHVCDRVAVMHQGQMVELASADDFFEHPSNPYSQRLLASVPSPVPGAQPRDDEGADADER